MEPNLSPPLTIKVDDQYELRLVGSDGANFYYDYYESGSHHVKQNGTTHQVGPGYAGHLNVRLRSDYGVSVIDHTVIPRGIGLGRKGLLAASQTFDRIHSMMVGGCGGGPSSAAQRAWQSLEPHGSKKRDVIDKQTGSPKGYIWEIDRTKKEQFSFKQWLLDN